MQKTILVGRVAREPEQRGSVTTMTIAVDGWDSATKTKQAEFFRVTMFGKTAEIAESYCTKGKWIGIVGKLKNRSWEDKNTGQKRSSIEIYVDELQLMGGGEDTKRPGPSESEDTDEDPFG